MTTAKQQQQPLSGVYSTLPAHLYTDAAVFADEQRQIFSHSWHMVAHQSQLPEPGSYLTCEVAGESVIVMRGKDGQIRAFYNVCIHRAHQLLSDCDQLNHISCPYHAWTFNTEGQLMAVPNGKNFQGFNAGDYQLASVPVEMFLGLVLVNLDKQATSFAEQAGEALGQIADYAPNLADCQHAHRTERVAQANWKVVMENFNECYHCAVVHRTLTTGVVDPRSYQTRYHSYGIYHQSPARQKHQSYSYVADAEAKTDYFLTWWFWPLFAVQVYPGGVYNTYRWIPLDEGRTKIEVDWWLAGEARDFEREIIHQHASTTFAEDAPIVDSVQRGLRSRGYQQGPVLVDEANSSRSEHPILAFQQHYLAAYQPSLIATDSASR